MKTRCSCFTGILVECYFAIFPCVCRYHRHNFTGRNLDHLCSRRQVQYLWRVTRLVLCHDCASHLKLRWLLFKVCIRSRRKYGTVNSIFVFEALQLSGEVFFQLGQTKGNRDLVTGRSHSEYLLIKEQYYLSFCPNV